MHSQNLSPLEIERISEGNGGDTPDGDSGSGVAYLETTVASRNPMTCIGSCCARAASGHIAAAPPLRAKSTQPLENLLNFEQARSS